MVSRDNYESNVKAFSHIYREIIQTTFQERRAP